MKPLDLPDVSRETLEKLRLYHGLLLKWQEKINLISPYTVPDAWERHFVDSAQLSALLPSSVTTLVDLGSGAGFAGLVLAIIREEIGVTLVESDAKKCAFLQTVSRETGVRVAIQNARIEAALPLIPAPEIVTARALAPLKLLLDFVRPWTESRPDIRLIFPKGGQFLAEIAEAKAIGWEFLCDEIPSRTEPSSRILSLTNVRKR